MKPYLLLFPFLTIAMTCLWLHHTAQEKIAVNNRTIERLKKATIQYVPLATKAPVVVSCDQLRTVFGKKLNTVVIADQQKLKEIATLFRNANSAKDRMLNVRVKFILQYTEHTETYCMDREGTLEGYDFRWDPKIVKWFKQEIER